MDVSAVTSVIGQFGFPIVVAGYLLVRMETTIKGLTDSNNKMIVVLNLIANKEGVASGGN